MNFIALQKKDNKVIIKNVKVVDFWATSISFYGPDCVKITLWCNKLQVFLYHNEKAANFTMVHSI